MKRRLAVWLVGMAGLWWLTTPRPRHTFDPAGPVWVTAAGVVLVARTIPRPPPDPRFAPPPFYPNELYAAGPLEARELATGRLLWTAHGPADGVGVEPTADGSRVRVSVGRPLAIRPEADELRDAATGAVVGRFPHGTVFSPPDARFALVEADLIETTTGRWVRTLPAGPYPAFSNDGRRLLVPHFRYRGGRVYDAADGRLVSDFPEPRDPRWLGPDGRRLIDPDGVVWDVDTHAAVGRAAVAAAGRGAHDGGWVSPDGRWAAEWLDGTDDAGRPAAEWVRLPAGERRGWTPPAGWRVSSHSAAAGGRLLEVNTRRERPATAAARWLARQAPAFRELGFGRTDRRVTLVDADTATTLAELGDEESVECLLADGRTLVTRTYREGRPPRLAVWDFPTRRPWGWLAAGVVGWTLAVGWVGRVRWTA